MEYKTKDVIGHNKSFIKLFNGFIKNGAKKINIDVKIIKNEIL